MSSRTLLLTGAAGFLGRFCAREFTARGWAVTGADRGPSEFAPDGIAYERIELPSAALGALIRQVRPDACIHAAGCASVAFSMEQPGVDFHAGVVVTFELLEALRRFAPGCRTVLLSSAAVYGNPAALPVGEEQAPAPLSPYGFHKLQGELLADEFAQLFGLPVAVARVFSAYGPGLQRQVVWDTCGKLLRRGDVHLRGTGEESRDFIHAADVASALATLVEAAPLRGERYNVASGVETSIAALATDLARCLRPEARLVFDGRQNPGDPLNWRADIARLTALGFRPAVPLAHGLRETAEWARAQTGVLV